MSGRPSSNGEAPVWVRENAGKLRVLSIAMAAMALLCAGAWIFSLYRTLASPGYGGQSVDIDFTVFWGAARLVVENGWENGWLAPFDLDRLSAARGLPPGSAEFDMVWAYPPGYLMLLWPLGFLPFFWAWLAFGLVSAAALGAALRGSAQVVPGAGVAVLAAPVCMITLALGQNSLLTAALLVGALEAIRRDRAVLAGLLIACLTLKPQLGVMIPVALIAGGYWRAILCAAIGAILLVAATTAVAGIEYWSAFLDGLGTLSDYVREGRFERTFVISGYGAAVALGVDHDSALVVQVLLSIGVAAGLVWLWRQRSVPFDLKAAGLCFAVLLATPYAMYYELVFAVLGGFYIARAGARGGSASNLVFVLFWLAPFPGLALLPTPGFAVLAPALVLGLLVCLRAAHRAVSA